MKRAFIAVLFLLLAGFAYLTLKGNKTPTAQALVAATIAPTSTPRPTETLIPSATIGYQDTAVVAQQTAMEAVRVNAQITAAFEMRVQEQLQITAEANRQYFEMMGWTQTAAPISIALTATQQAAANTQIAGNQTLQAGQLTATANAPTQIMEYAKAQSAAKHAETDYIGDLIGKSAIAFFCLAVGFYIIRKGLAMKAAYFLKIGKEQADQEEYHRPGVSVTLRDEKDPARSNHYHFPCSMAQLLELAEMVVNGRYTFAYNDMERNSRTFRNQREVLRETRETLEAAKLAVKTTNDESVINHRGKQFFEFIFENHELPEGFEIGEMA